MASAAAKGRLRMRFANVEISNLRAVGRASFTNLGDLVLIAGPNGVGKSCVLDGIRLLKSAYAGYQPNELNSWFSEYQINLQKKDEKFKRLFRDPQQPATICATVALADSERQYLIDNADDLLRNIAWRRAAPGRDDAYRAPTTSLADDLRTHAPRVKAQVQQDLPEFRKLLTTQTEFEARVDLRVSGEDSYQPNLVLEVLWGTFDPERLGILDFHNAHRTYNYENVGNIRLDIQATGDKYRQHALYGTGGKYSNIKSEMAAAFVRDLIARTAAERHGAPPTNHDASVVNTLREMFRRFFPGKEFLGPMAALDGSLSFPVRLASDGSSHDIDFLSSGEKEVLFGYLRLRNSAPRNSVIMIDEPELHLNPRLVKGLPDFYDKFIGKALNNQIWLVTHSDAFLRDAMRIPGASIWHMRNWTNLETKNQASQVAKGADLERVLLDLVGDIAGYRPGARIVIVEGEDSEFDAEMITRLFPDFAASVNIVSAGGRTRVEKLHELLDRATQSVGWQARFFAITDRDLDPGESATEAAEVRKFSWDVYHIENYLLEPRYIHKVLVDLGSTRFHTPEDVDTGLKAAAASCIPALVKILVRQHVDRLLAGAIRISPKTGQHGLAKAFATAATSAASELGRITASELSEPKLRKLELSLTSNQKSTLENGRWRSDIRGRDILIAFVREHSTLTYEEFRNLVIARMRDDSYEPPGMRAVLAAISSDSPPT